MVYDVFFLRKFALNSVDKVKLTHEENSKLTHHTKTCFVQKINRTKISIGIIFIGLIQ